MIQKCLKNGEASRVVNKTKINTVNYKRRIQKHCESSHRVKPTVIYLHMSKHARTCFISEPYFNVCVAHE